MWAGKTWNEKEPLPMRTKGPSFILCPIVRPCGRPPFPVEGINPRWLRSFEPNRGEHGESRTLIRYADYKVIIDVPFAAWCEALRMAGVVVVDTQPEEAPAVDTPVSGQNSTKSQ